jgi:hypothetical protein
MKSDLMQMMLRTPTHSERERQHVRAAYLAFTEPQGMRSPEFVSQFGHFLIEDMQAVMTIMDDWVVEFGKPGAVDPGDRRK